MFEQALRNIDDALRKEAGCATEAALEGKRLLTGLTGMTREEVLHG